MNQITITFSDPAYQFVTWRFNSIKQAYNWVNQQGFEWTRIFDSYQPVRVSISPVGTSEEIRVSCIQSWDELENEMECAMNPPNDWYRRFYELD